MTDRPDDGFDSAAAVTRSLLGWGVVVGPFYLLVGTLLGAVTNGFDFARHPLSLLMLADLGWIQTTNLVLSGLMVGAAALGVARAWPAERLGRWTAALLALAGVGLIGSAVFPPDPVMGFPPGIPAAATPSGIGHLAFGAVTFPALAAAAVTAGQGFGRRGEWAMKRYSVLSGAVILIGFVGGAALATTPIGVVSLWVAVVAGWAWLLVASLRIYGHVPHPDAHRRRMEPEAGGSERSS